MSDSIRALLFVFAILVLMAGLRMAFAVAQPFVASVPIAGPTAASALDYIII